MSLPSQVLSVDGLVAVVESNGATRTVSLMLLDEIVEVGDYLLVQHDRFAIERLDATQASEALALIEQALRREALERG